MFCLRSWLPLLFIPTNASPAFILLFFICTYFLNRPCVYCSLLLLILFFTSCNWSDNCFLDTNTSAWFDARPSVAGVSNGTLNTDGKGLWQGAYVDLVTQDGEIGIGDDAVNGIASELGEQAEWTGLGAGWLRSLLGKTEWTVDCLDLKVKL